MFLSLLCVGLTGMSGCTTIPETTYNEPLTQPEDSHPAPIRFTQLKNRLPLGAEIGYLRPNCTFLKKTLGRNAFRGMKTQDLEDAVSEMLEMQGYDIVDTLNTVLEEEEDDEYLRAEYRLGAKLIGAKADICDHSSDDSLIMGSLFPDMQGTSGRLSIEIEWGLYDTLRRSVVYKTTTKGYTRQNWGNVGGREFLFNEAFAMAAHNLGTNPQFHDLIFYGQKPDNSWRKNNKAPNEGRPRKFDPQEDVNIKNLPLWTKQKQANIKQAADNAVLIQTGNGYGSGFFIGKNGYILTNSHVVGDALRVRIVTAHKKEKLTAEVLRSHKGRDVALLRLENMPEDLEINPVPIKVAWPKVSEDIYAVGAPARYKMQDSITKGIVSAHRHLKVEALVANYIQGDVRTIKDSNGGPLLDGNGNIVGITKSALYQFDSESDSGLNLFIPIGEALDYLHIDLIEP
ncbi:MAG: trypsin-like peptidase domain-containing protein [Alphaproteobacteria bacterium]|nr:trypsin-like peptidase domain-containing protein [Alphaproteobacteria bacterium]